MSGIPTMQSNPPLTRGRVDEALQKLQSSLDGKSEQRFG